MATRYWVGGSGTWSDTATANWSASSGGASGASAPGNSDPIVFDANSGSGTITVTTGGSFATCAGFDSSGITGTLVINSGSASSVQCRGNMVLKNTQINQQITFLATSTSTYTISSDVTDATVTYSSAPSYLRCATSGTGVTLSLASKMAFRSLIVAQGTFSSNNYDFTASSISTSSGTTVNLGSSTVRFDGGNSINSGTTWNAGTSTVNYVFVSGLSATIDSGGKTWYNVNVKPSQSSVTIVNMTTTGTYRNLSFDSGQLQAVSFEAGTTTTITGALTWPNGTSQNPVSVNSSTPGSAATISQSSGTVNAQYLSLQDSTITGGATYNAINSTNYGNNTGWNFVGFPPKGMPMSFF